MVGRAFVDTLFRGGGDGNTLVLVARDDEEPHVETVAVYEKMGM